MYKKRKETLLLFALILFLFSCREMWGDHPLGNNLSLLEGDKKEDRIIVYCSGKSAGVCVGGIPVLHVYNRQFDSSGHCAEYVESAASNKKWVIAKTLRIKGKKENYWIISKDFDITNLDCAKANCDSILQSHVTGPLDQSGFENKEKELDIDLNFE